VRPPGEKSSAGGRESGEALGTVRAGDYLLRVGGSGGTIVESGAGAADDSLESLAQALQAGDGKRSAVDAVADTVNDAAAVTGKIERAVALGKGAAEGKALDPEQLVIEVDSLVGLLERLDREGRWKEALRLARAVSTLASLIKRWLALLRALRAALRAGEKLGDLEAIAWAKHELGTLQLVAGDVNGAERNLREALETRERIGDRAGVAATARNTQALCERLRRMLRERELVQRGGGRRVLRLSPLLVVLFALLALALGGGAGAMLASGGDGSGGDVNSGHGKPADGKPQGETHSLLVTIEGAGTVTSNPAGIECASDTIAASDPGSASTEMRLVATGDGVAVPEESSKLGAAEEEAGTTTVPPEVTEPPEETTQPPEETTTQPSEEPGGGEDSGEEATDGPDTGACEHRFEAGSTVILTGESKYAEVTGNCSPSSETECSVSMDSDEEVALTFEAIGTVD
jgi:hypothetical protein